MQSLLTIIKIFIDICLWRKRPQDLPASREFLVVCLLIYTLLSIFMALPGQPPVNAVLMGLMDTALMLIVVFFLLSLRKFQERWIQTCTAMAGAGAVLSLLGSPLVYWLGGLDPGETISFEPILLFWILVIWNILVMGHIFRHAISVSFPAGVIISICYVVSVITITTALFPIQSL